MRRLIIVALLFACSAFGSTESDALIDSIKHCQRVTYPVQTYDTTTWKGRQVHYPNILNDPWDSDSIMIYFGAGSYDITNSFNIGLAKAHKNTPLQWNERDTSLLSFPVGGAYTAVGPHHVFYNDTAEQIWMYTTCFISGGGNSWQGLFKSADGITFTYYGAVLTKSGDELVLGDAGYIQSTESDTFYCYYTYRTAAGTLPGIRMARSVDGVTWVKDTNRVVSVGDAYDSRFIEGTSVVKRGGSVVLLYSAYNGTDYCDGTWSISAAVSEGYGGPFTKHASNPILSPTALGWESRNIATAFVWDGYIFYQGTNALGAAPDCYTASLWSMGYSILSTEYEDGLRHPTGVQYYDSITTHNAYVDTSVENHVSHWKIPLSETVQTVCDSENNVIVYSRDGTQIASCVTINNDTAYVTAKTHVLSDADTTYYVGFGTEINTEAYSETYSSYFDIVWPFDEKVDGDTAYDRIEVSDGVVYNTATLANAGKFSKSAEFFGSNSHIKTLSQSFSGIPKFTITACVKFKSTAGTQVIFRAGTDAALSAQIAYVTGRIFVYTMQAQNQSVLFTPDTSKWYMLTYTYDGGATPKTKLYIDDSLQTYTATTGGTPGTVTPTYADGYVMAGYSASDVDLIGYLDNLLISASRTMQGKEVTNYYNSLFVDETYSVSGSMSVDSSSSSNAAKQFFFFGGRND